MNPFARPDARLNARLNESFGQEPFGQEPFGRGLAPERAFGQAEGDLTVAHQEGIAPASYASLAMKVGVGDFALSSYASLTAMSNNYGNTVSLRVFVSPWFSTR